LRIILDAGDGLSQWLEEEGKPPREAWLLLTRYQDEVLRELAAAEALVAAGCRLTVGGPDSPENVLQHLGPKLIAETKAGSRAHPRLLPLREGDLELAPGLRVRAQYALHPELTLAYRLEFSGRTVIWCPAHEVDPEPKGWRGHEMDKFRAFFASADLLIHGYRRSLADKALDDGLGRGAWEPVVDLAAEAKVRHLVLVPLQGAKPIPDLQARAQKRAAGKGAMECSAPPLPSRLALDIS
jgi:hypothetical protein